MRVIVLALIASVLLPPGAAACTCFFPTKPPTDAELARDIAAGVREAKAVFRGRVLTSDTYTVTFEVDAVWKGNVARRFAMPSGAVPQADGTVMISSCDFPFERDKTYIVLPTAPRFALHTPVNAGGRRRHREARTLSHTWTATRGAGRQRPGVRSTFGSVGAPAHAATAKALTGTTKMAKVTRSQRTSTER